MPKLTIDNREVEVAHGATVLDAARKLGIDIPTMCYRDGLKPNTSCMVCVVKLARRSGFVPSCGMPAVDGMHVESDTDEVARARRSAVELLLSDHLGDCMAPCHCVCPAEMNIPLMIRQIAAGQMRDAVATVKADIALPAVLGRICPAPCEKGCRRAQIDAGVSICLLKRHVADMDLAGGDPWRPDLPPDSGRRVAIVGGGPTGLAAAYYLRRFGHAAVVLDDADAPGGMLRRGVEADRLPRDVLDAEIATIAAVGAELRRGVRVGRDVPMDELLRDYDAVLAAPGAIDEEQAALLRLPWAGKAGVKYDRHTYATGAGKLFAACSARQQKLTVRAVADGKGAATAIHQFLTDLPLTGRRRPFTCHVGRLREDEGQLFLAEADARARVEPGDPPAGFTAAEAAAECSRCLHCDCRAADDCLLRRCAEQLGADASKHKTERRTFEQQRHAAGVIYEPGKCINCGLCVQVTAAAGERLGLAFSGRGFKARIRVPLGHSLTEGLAKAAAEVVAACPTGALTFRDAPRK